jgi:pyrroloquinoline-quinone synthase
MFAPTLVGKRIGVIEQHYPWVKREGLEYFRRRLEQAPRDAEHALELVIQSARSREDQEKAIAALRFKCDVLWALVDAVEQAYTRQGVACPSR